MSCEFAENWKNQEGWLVTESRKLVCLDWGDFCTKCRVNDSEDYVFAIRSLTKEEQQ